LLLSISHTVLSQQLHIENLSIKNGLPNNSIQDIYKDSKGTMWLGTNSGLCKYDGRKIKIYTTRDGLSGNKIWGIEEDSDGILWLATYGNGISYYDGKRFKPLVLHDSINKSARCIAYDRTSDYMLFGTDKGLIVKTKHDSILYFNHTSVHIDKLQVIDIQQIGGVFLIYTYWFKPTYIFNPKDNSLTEYKSFTTRNYTRIACGIVSNNGDTLIGNGKDTLTVLKKDTALVYSKTGQIFDMCKGKQGDIWLAGWDISLNGENGGLFKFANDTLIDVTEKFDIPSRLIWSLYYDTLEHILWIGTNDKGLFLYKNETFNYYDFGTEELDINHIQTHKQSIWVASNNEVFEFNKSTVLRTYNKKYFESAYRGTMPLLKEYYKNPDMKIMAHYFNTDKNNNLYLSSDVGFFKLTQDKEFKFLTTINTPFVFDNNRLLTVGWGYLFEYPDLPDFSKNIQMLDWAKKSMPVDVNKIVTHNGLIWFLSFARGLFLLDHGKYTWFNKNNKTLDNHIIDLVFDQNDNMYLAQNNGELLVAQYQSDTLQIVQRLACNEQITGNVIKWLACNEQNKLFIGTDLGLNYIDLNHIREHQYQFRFYNEKEGYHAFESTMAIVDSVGNIWVNTNKGLLRIMVEDFNHTLELPSVKITGIDLFNQPKDSLLFINKPFFDYNQNYISFHFNRNNYTNADKDIYHYRLKGLSDNWIQTQNSYIDYFNLPDGNYTFEIKCYNTNTKLFSNTAQYSFVIRKAWWYSYWFYSGVLLLIGVVIWAYLSIKLKKINRDAKKTNEINKKIAEIEMKALQSQMNPHFVFNALNSIQNFVLNGSIDDTLTYMSHFSILLRGTLNYASEKRITIEQEIEFLSHYIALEQMRFKQPEKEAFSIEFIVDVDIYTNDKIMPPMLLQPIIENAIKHGEIHLQEKGTIIIEFKQFDEILYCSVTDNGIGIEASSTKKQKHHQSKAISIIKDRIQLMSNSDDYGLEIENLTPGTKIILRLPII